MIKGESNMKKTNKTLVVAIVMMALSVALAVTTLASSGTITRTLQAHFRGIQIFLDGNRITPRDGQGNIVEPFIVDGTTYLPLRAVAEALGLEVNWDGATNSVFLGEMPANAQPPAQPPTQPPTQTGGAHREMRVDRGQSILIPAEATNAQEVRESRNNELIGYSFTMPNGRTYVSWSALPYRVSFNGRRIEIYEGRHLRTGWSEHVDNGDGTATVFEDKWVWELTFEEWSASLIALRDANNQVIGSWAMHYDVEMLQNFVNTRTPIHTRTETTVRNDPPQDGL
jgi:hypothetical protein